jgi:hypothetical protein
LDNLKKSKQIDDIILKLDESKATGRETLEKNLADQSLNIKNKITDLDFEQNNPKSTYPLGQFYHFRVV